MLQTSMFEPGTCCWAATHSASIQIPALAASPIVCLGVQGLVSEVVIMTHQVLLLLCCRVGPHLAAYQGAAHDAATPEGSLLPPGRVARSEFNSNKLAPKLAQQLKVLPPVFVCRVLVTLSMCWPLPAKQACLPCRCFDAWSCHAMQCSIGRLSRLTYTNICILKPRRRAALLLLDRQRLEGARTNAQDVLAICGGTLPAWCERLVFGSRFLFPFALRRAWFRATALGLPRALAYLQSLAAAEGAASQDVDRDERAARVGRLTRQKVSTASRCAVMPRLLSP